MGKKKHKPGGGLEYLGGGLWGVNCGGKLIPVGYMASDGQFLGDCDRPWVVTSDPDKDDRKKIKPEIWHALQEDDETAEPSAPDPVPAELEQAAAERAERARAAMQQRRAAQAAGPVQSGFEWAANLGG